MKQRAHAWMAFRALKLLEDDGRAKELVELLSYYLSDAWEGAWLPDTLIVDMIYGHVNKMESDPAIADYNPQDKRATVPYKALKKRLKGKRLMLDLVKKSPVLDAGYWSVMGHLPNRVIALSHQAGDMLKMSDYPLSFYAKKEKPKQYRKDLTEQKVKDLSQSPNFSARQIALVFFMLSHYISDAHMPLHCDLRDASVPKTVRGKRVGRRLPEKLHPSIEEEWEGYFPLKRDLALSSQTKESVSDIVLKKMPKNSPIRIDTDKRYGLGTKLVLPAGDEWTEMIFVTRTSFAVAREWIKEPYKDAKAFIKAKGKEEFEDVTNRIFHDAVQSVAMVWYKAWKRYKE
jgi:hypothetical protein